MSWVLAVLLALGSAPLPPVGVILAVDDPEARLLLRENLAKHLGPETQWNCRETTVCLEVTAVPIVTGKATSGWAVAARFSRRLKASPDWPAAAEEQNNNAPRPVVEIIEDTTASGDMTCLPCEEAKAACRQQLDTFREFAEQRFEELGGLFLQVGPAKNTFWVQVANDLARELTKQLGKGVNP